MFFVRLANSPRTLPIPETPLITYSTTPSIQVAGHLFEEGKAGSLVDDRGHFYKPIQPGPRGDRERAFYQAIQGAVAADQITQALRKHHAAAAAVPHSSTLSVSSSSQVSSSTTTSTADKEKESPTRKASAASPLSATPPVAVPWATKRLPSHAFPSFKDSYREVRQRDPMQILQQDEMGLVTASELGDWLIDLHEVSSEDDDDDAEIVINKVNTTTGGGGENINILVENSEVIPLTPSRDWYGRSPDSDEGNMPMTTGDHVMEGITSAHMEAQQHRLVGGGDRLLMSSTSTTTSAPNTTTITGFTVGSSSTGAGVDATSSGSSGPTDHIEINQRQQTTNTPSASASIVVGVDEQAAALLGQPTFGWAGPDNGGSYINTSTTTTIQQPHYHTTHTVCANGSNGGGGALTEALERLHIDITGHGTGGGGGSGGSKNEEEEEQQLQRPPSPFEKTTTTTTTTDNTEVYDTDFNQEHQQQQQQITSTAAAAHAGVDMAAVVKEFNTLPFALRNAPLLRVLPRFYGVRQGDGRTLLELEDLARSYSHPCIMDIKIGYRTWYSQADAAYIERCKQKDASTTQAALGFKICGMQVYRHGQGGYWRASKRWCKTLPEVLVDKALLSFVHNEHSLRPSDVYGGPHGAVSQLEALAAWFQLQHEFRFYSASILILYEGDASDAASAAVRVKLVDFAHTFRTDEGGRDENFLNGLTSLMTRLNGVARIEAADLLM